MAPCPQHLEYWILWVKCDGSKSLVNCKIIINLIELDSGERSFFSAPGLLEVVLFTDSLAWILPGLGIPEKLINLNPLTVWLRIVSWKLLNLSNDTEITEMSLQIRPSIYFFRLQPPATTTESGDRERSSRSQLYKTYFLGGGGGLTLLGV